MKKTLSILTIFLIFVLKLYPFPGPGEQLRHDDEIRELILSETIPEISATSVLVGDAETGKIIYEKNADEMRQIASLVKIMTAIVVLQNASLNDVVRVKKVDKKLNSWLLGLKRGQNITIRNLLLAFLIESRNDAALVAAEGIAKTEKRFVDMMNEEAKKLSLKNTIFGNCNGLDLEEKNFSNAHDLFRMTLFALKNPVFREIVKMKEADITWTGSAVESRHLKNVNKMLELYEGVDGVKTGYTRAAGRCIIVSCRRGDFRIICVLLNSRDIWSDSKLMLDHIFAKLKIESL